METASMFDKLLLGSEKLDLIEFRVEVEKFNLMLISSIIKLHEEIRILNSIEIPTVILEQYVANLTNLQGFNNLVLENLKTFNSEFSLKLSENCMTKYIYYQKGNEYRKINLITKKLWSKLKEPGNIDTFEVYICNLINTKILYILLDHLQFIELLDENFREHIHQLCVNINKLRINKNK